ncbi:MAG: acyltransferase [Rhodothermaceae bacterium]|nr:acyltransferase [Rhodothermaceae bacterium]
MNNRMGARLARRLVDRLIRRDLQRTFRRVVWLSGVEALPDGPLVVYANHHSFYDGYLFWLLVRHTLRRPLVIWMEEWDLAPLFGPIGVLPFPAEDALRRTTTIRETARRLAADPRTVLLLFPEGDLRPPDQGLGAFRADLDRLARVLPEAVRWQPLGIHLTWWGEDRPTALLSTSPPHDAPDGKEADRLRAALDATRAVSPAVLQENRARLLLDGQPSVHERWDLRALAPLFRRWT